MDAESRVDYCRPGSARVPRQRYARAEEPLGVVLRENRVAESRRSLEHSVRAGNEICGPSRFFIPAVVEFMAQADLQR